MSLCNLHLSHSNSVDAGTFKLLELPPDLCSLVEDSITNASPLSLSIKGDLNEDAVLCTENKTFAIRSVALSNSILVVAPPVDSTAGALPDNAVVIRDTVKEILEVVPSIPRINKLILRLRGREYDGPQEDVQSDVKSYTYADAQNEIQASQMELDVGLRRNRILQVNGELRPISVAYLDHILEAVLNLLVSLSLPHTGVPVEKLLDSVVNDHEVPRSVAVQVMQWFGDIHNDGKWAMDAGSVIQELGLSILRNHKHRPISKDALLTQWRGLVGDTFEKGVNLNLLAGNYIEDARKAQMLSYFPASDLPMEPVARFRDLFLTKSRWKVEDITPFLSDIAVDTKERDRLLLKYARGVTDAEGLWYTARAQYSG